MTEDQKTRLAELKAKTEILTDAEAAEIKELEALQTPAEEEAAEEKVEEAKEEVEEEKAE